MSLMSLLIFLRSSSMSYHKSLLLQKQKFSGRKASKRLQHVLEKKANKMFLKASQTLEQSTGLTLGNRRLTALGFYFFIIFIPTYIF